MTPSPLGLAAFLADAAAPPQPNNRLVDNTDLLDSLFVLLAGHARAGGINWCAANDTNSDAGAAIYLADVSGISSNTETHTISANPSHSEPAYITSELLKSRQHAIDLLNTSPLVCVSSE